VGQLGETKKSSTEFWSRKLYSRDYMKALSRQSKLRETDCQEGTWSWLRIAYKDGLAPILAS